MIYHTLIIGKGPAGLSSGIYLSRAGKKVLVIGENNVIWNKNVKVNNYFGTGEVNGFDLMETGLKQAKSFGCEIVNDLILKIGFDEKVFTAFTKDNEFKANNVILATGGAKKKIEISNETDWIGKGVSYCVPCDGFFFKNKKVFVVGNGEFALAEAIELLTYTKDVTLVSNGKEIVFDKKILYEKGIKFESFKIEKIVGKDKIESVKTLKGEIKIDGVFIASGNANSNDLCRMLGVITKDNEIIVDNVMKTNLPFVWAAGDCTPGLHQISTAVSKGSIAATDIIKNEMKK